MKLKAYLKMTGTSAVAFSKEAECSHTTINNICKGKHKLGRLLARQIIKATDGKVGLPGLGLSKDYLDSR